jgi:Dyp-type peroxidase family
MTDAARLRLSTYRKTSNWAAFGKFLYGRDGRIILWPLLALAAVFVWGFWPSATGPLVWKLLATATKAVLATTLVSAVLIALFLIKLRQAETTEQPDTSQAPLDTLRAIMAQENPPGHAHNHILAVGTMKPGPFRAFVHAFALWAIRNLIVYGFRPGFVINMGTIHYARWWRLPGTNKVCFYSNFDGSWESYLEDFITRARQGQSAAWSNWQGFPRTRFLINEGAQDGDAFKRWVRTVQQLVPFWYSRFPELTTDRIRGNALIHAGAGLARSPSDCEEWLRCFGSMPRTANRIESDEVQALVFRGMKRLPYSAVIALRLPPEGEALGEWLSWLRGKPMQAGLGGESQIAALLEAGVLVPVPRPVGRTPEYALAHSLCVAFGDRPLTGDDAVGPAEPVPTGQGAQRDAMASARQAVFFGLSAAGMAKFEAPAAAPGTLLEAFPYAYRMGMAARAKINGDLGANAPESWRWQDDPRDPAATEAVLMVFAASPEELARVRQVHELLLANHGGAVLGATDCAPAFADPAKAEFEHFGYRDGIAQPVIRGTTRSLRGVPERDVVEPGEFILGYKNGPGYYPPSPLLPREADRAGALPPPLEIDLSRYPDFGEKALSEGPRDLGRNGTYLVLRELRQDVEGFEHFCTDAAERLNAGGLGELYKLTGQRADSDWVKAKLMGRWPDGRPLIGNPVQVAAAAIQPGAERDNDFAYGVDDPQGLACPFGAHIRRTNPRDSKQPGDAAEQTISNRHRLLRRGRAYTKPETGEKGLLFASLCADIERQFEFVQQFWANAPAFHGLNAEPDPIAGNDPLDPDGTPIDARVFTIPTVAGPVRLDGLKSFVTTMAGGYFFLPSRSALGWLTETALHAPSRTTTP